MSPELPQPPDHHVRNIVAGIATLATIAGGATFAIAESLPHRNGPAQRFSAAPVTPVTTAPERTPTTSPTPRPTDLHSAPTVSASPKATIDPAHLSVGRIPTQTHDVAPSNEKLFSLGDPAGWVVSAAAQKFIERDTALLPTNGCTGQIVRNNEGVAMGVVTAEHCGLRGAGGDSTPRVTGSDGKTYIVTGAPEVAETGKLSTELQLAGTFNAYLVAPPADTSFDIAYGSFDGFTPQQVASQFEASRANPANLQRGQEVFMGGWPVEQPGNPGPDERQDFSMRYIGRETAYQSALGETLDIVWTAVANNKDKAACTPRTSGADAFIIENGQRQNIGPESAYWPLTGDDGYGKKHILTAEETAVRRAYFQTQFGVDLSQVDALCGFSVGSPDQSAAGGVIIHPVAAAGDIPR